jgi:hypothetical protein
MAHEFKQALAAWFERSTSPDFAVAVALTLMTLLGAGIRQLWIAPDLLIFIPGFALLLAALSAMLLFMGGIGWLLFQGIRLIGRWRAREELREGMTRTQVVGVWVVVIFFFIPEVAEAFRWWQEHVWSHIPGEESTVDRIVTFCLTNQPALVGGLTLVALGCFFFWKVYEQFRERLRRSVALTRGLLEHRVWRFPAFLMATVSVITAWYRIDGSPRIGHLLALTVPVVFVCLLLWVALPLIVSNRRILTLSFACIVPAVVFNERLGGKSLVVFVLVLVVWSGWLFSIVWASRRNLWRPVYWVGVLGSLGYLVS